MKNCLDILPSLKKQYETKAKGRKLTEQQEKELALQIALDHHKSLWVEMNKIKPQGKYVKPDVKLPQQKSPEIVTQATQKQENVKETQTNVTNTTEKSDTPQPGSKVEFEFAGSERTGTVVSVNNDVYKIKDPSTGRTYPVKKENVGKVVGFVKPGGGNLNFSLISDKQLANIKSWLKDKLFVRGLFNQNIFENLKKNEANISAEAVRMNINIRRAMDAIKKDFPGNKADEAFIDAVLHGDVPLQSLPQATREAVERYRDHIKQLQELGIDNGALSDIEELVRKNTNYLTRSYAINDIPEEFKNWLREDPEGQAIYNKAVLDAQDNIERGAMNLFSQATRLRDRAKQVPDIIARLEKRKEKIKEAYQFTARVSPKTVREQSIKRDDQLAKVDAMIDKLKSRDFLAEADKLEAEARELQNQDPTATIEALLAEKDPAKAIVSGGRAGAMDVGILKKRKDISEPIRELFGEYKNPHINYAKTITKLAALVHNYGFQSQIRAQELGKTMFERPVGNYTSQIAPEGSDSMRGLTQGKPLYTTKELADAFNNYNVKDAYIPVWSWLVKLNALGTYAKTVLTPATHPRNFLGAGIMAQLNGHLFEGGNWTQASKAAFSDLMQKSDDQMTEYLVDLARRGIIHESAAAGTLKDYAKEAYKLSPDEFVIKTSEKAANIKKNAFQGLNRAYRIEDDFWKILQYENELKRFSENNPKNLSEEELKDKAARYVRRGTSVYSLTPKAVNWIRRMPFVSSFPTFPYQVARATYGTVLNIQEDLKDGNKALAAKRIAGLTSAYAASYILVAMAKDAVDLDDEEEKALDSFLPAWAKGGQRWYTDFNRSGDKITFVDLTYSDPLSAYKKITSATPDAFESEEGREALAGSLAEFFRPFYDEEVLTQKIVDWMRNKNGKTGYPVYNEEDDLINKIAATMDHFWSGMEPGALKSAKNIQKALSGEKSKTGKEFSITDEMLFNLTGQKIETIDLRQSYKFQMSRIRQRLNNAKQLKFQYPNDEAKGAQVTEEAIQSIMQDARNLYRDAQKLGVDPGFLKRTNADILSNQQYSDLLN